MPLYTFLCKKCNNEYDELCSYDSKGKYKGVKCPACKSSKKEKQVTTFGVSFVNPIGTSKMDNFEYQAGWRLDRAKDERRAAEAKSHVGSSPYNNIDDINSGENFGEVK